MYELLYELRCPWWAYLYHLHCLTTQLTRKMLCYKDLVLMLIRGTFCRKRTTNWSNLWRIVTWTLLVNIPMMWWKSPQRIRIKYMSRVMTKPTLWVCNQHGSRPACASAQSDQDPCWLLTNRIKSREPDSEQHGSW
jgi:hypothetical protein